MRNGGKNVFYRVNGLMDHKLAETVVLAMAARRRFLTAAFAVRTQSLMLQFDVLRRTSVALDNVNEHQCFVRD